MSICVRLAEKGLLERRHVTAADKPARSGKAYVYTPRLSEEAFTRAAVEQCIEPMLAQYPALVHAQITGVPMPSRCSVSDRARVEYILAYLGTLRDPQDQPIEDTVLDTIVALLERAEAAERAAERAERQQVTGLRQMNCPPHPERLIDVRVEAVREYRDPAGICRVCARKAPPQPATRRDDLRVCRADSCRQEARRRDNNTKQRRYKERKLAGSR